MDVTRWRIKMSKYRIEIDIDIPDGWKPVAFRLPKKGVDYVFAFNTKILLFDWDNPENYYFVIVEEIK